MKRLMILGCMICCLFAVHAQNAKKATSSTYKGTGAEIKFENVTVDFGTLKVGDVKVVTVKFKNIGKKPLILDDVISSCDCTTADWSKMPVMPGKEGVIKATYTAKHTGLISKRLTVLSNANTDRIILQLKGEVK